MTKNEWWAMVDESADILEAFIDEYHPGMGKVHEMNITASKAEAARAEVVEHIKCDGEPMAFGVIRSGRDVEGMLKLLDEAWFGVPESIGCWDIAGFDVAVNLLEDPPDEEA